METTKYLILIFPSCCTSTVLALKHLPASSTCSTSTIFTELVKSSGTSTSTGATNSTVHTGTSGVERDTGIYRL
jgi:hypothetical protein